MAKVVKFPPRPKPAPKSVPFTPTPKSPKPAPKPVPLTPTPKSAVDLLMEIMNGQDPQTAALLNLLRSQPKDEQRPPAPSRWRWQLTPV